MSVLKAATIAANRKWVKRPLAPLCLALACIATAPAEDLPLGARAVAALPAVTSDKVVFDAAAPASLKIRIDLKTATLTVTAGGKVALTSPICAGRRSQPTPTGTFKISAKSAALKPDTFGRLIDSNGKTVAPVAYTKIDPVAPGLRFERAERTLVLHLGDAGPLVHAGQLSPVPCSDGAVIVPKPVAQLLAAKIPLGCPVEIVSGSGG